MLHNRYILIIEILKKEIKYLFEVKNKFRNIRNSLLIIKIKFKKTKFKSFQTVELKFMKRKSKNYKKLSKFVTSKSQTMKKAILN